MSTKSAEPTYYDLLGVDADATPREIKQAYRRKVRLTHPDLRGPESDAELFQRVRRAYEVLGNAEERLRYDMMMGLGEYEGRARLYRPSFNRLFSALFSGLRAAMARHADLSEEMERSRRQAG
ncbi:MAG: J domain-containing protein [Candidatus Brocadiaceae bacterium]|jgi:curved DNA-binding protein CbpA